MTTTEYNNIIKSLAQECKDADWDTIKHCVAYHTSEESGYALGCDYDKVLVDTLWQMRCL